MNTEYQIAKATAAKYVQATARAQVAYDLKVRDCIGDEEFNTGEFALYADREWKRLEFCKAKAREWGIKAHDLNPEEIKRRQNAAALS